MKTVESVRKDIVEAFFNRPKFGKNYVNYTTEDGKCAVKIIFRDQQFDIIVSSCLEQKNI